jgi:hypothetical protein
MADLPNFALSDQHGNTRNCMEWTKAVLILVGGDKDGSKMATEVGFKLYNSLSDEEKQNVSIVPIADLRGVPWLFRKLVTAFMPSNVDTVLMDWNGDVVGLYSSFKKSHGGIVIFNQQRQVLYEVTVSQEQDPDLLAKPLDIIRTYVHSVSK